MVVLLPKHYPVAYTNCTRRLSINFQNPYLPLRRNCKYVTDLISYDEMNCIAWIYRISHLDHRRQYSSTGFFDFSHYKMYNDIGTCILWQRAPAPAIRPKRNDNDPAWEIFQSCFFRFLSYWWRNYLEIQYTHIATHTRIITTYARDMNTQGRIPMKPPVRL